MAQHDYSIANASGASVRADLNNVLAAIKSLNAGASAPSGAVEGMMWVDTTNHKLKIYDGAGWEEIGDYTNKGLGLLDNAELTGDPTAPTQPVTDKSTKIATTAFVNSLTSSESRAGIVEKATDAEVDARADNSRWFSVKQLLRLFASNTDVANGTSDDTFVSPAGLASMRASNNEASAGANTSKFVTPKQLADYVEQNAGGDMLLGHFTGNATLTFPDGTKVVRVHIAAGAGGGGGGASYVELHNAWAGGQGSHGYASSFGNFITIGGGTGGYGGSSLKANGSNGGSHGDVVYYEPLVADETDGFSTHFGFAHGGLGGVNTNHPGYSAGGRGGDATVFTFLVDVSAYTSTDITVGFGGRGGDGHYQVSNPNWNGGTYGGNGGDGMDITADNGATGGGGGSGFCQVWRVS